MNIAVILAGGSGTRMGAVDKPKQFLEVYGKPLIIYTIETFEISSDIDEIVIVCHEDWIEELIIWCRKYDLTKVKYVISGGKTRQESSLKALYKLKETCNEADIVIIHDGARPLITNRIIKENVELAKKYNAVDTVIPTNDTIVKSNNGNYISEIPLRKILYLGQTPQTFKFTTIMRAHENAIKNNIVDSTDDCQLVLKCNENVYLVNGDKFNFKITTFEDLTLFKAILKMGKLEVN